jgi:hypothetical protein
MKAAESMLLATTDWALMDASMEARREAVAEEAKSDRCCSSSALRARSRGFEAEEAVEEAVSGRGSPLSLTARPLSSS